MIHFVIKVVSLTDLHSTNTSNYNWIFPKNFLLILILLLKYKYLYNFENDQFHVLFYSL